MVLILSFLKISSEVPCTIIYTGIAVLVLLSTVAFVDVKALPGLTASTVTPELSSISPNSVCAYSQIFSSISEA